MQFDHQKIVVVGGFVRDRLRHRGYGQSARWRPSIASRPGQRLENAAKSLGVKAIAADVTSDEAVENLFRQCGAVDHVIMTAAQLRTGPIKTLSIADAKATMEGKFWGGGSRVRLRSSRADH